MSTHPSQLPPGMLPDGVQLLTVEPYEVERGDRIVGLRTVVDSVLYDGNVGRWLYADAGGRIICRRPAHRTVMVMRGGLSSHDTPGHGIRRHLTLVAR